MKKNLILIITFFILFWTYYLVDKSKNITTLEWSINPIDFSQLNYDNLSYTNNFWEWIVISKTWEEYFVSKIWNNKKFKAQSDLMSSLIDNIKGTEINNIAANNKNSWESFEISLTWSSLNIWWTKILFWKRESYQKEFIVIEWDEKVYEINKVISLFLSRWDINTFRDKTIYKNSDIDQIETYTWDEYKLYIKSSSWWTLSWELVTINHLTNLIWNNILNEKTFENEKDWYIKYFKSWNIVNEIKIKFDDNSGYIDVDSEFFLINKNL